MGYAAYERPGLGAVGAGCRSRSRCRAANIVACRAIEPSAVPGGWCVQSESDPATDYIVLNPGFDIWSCTCKDWARRSPAACKHIFAVSILRECEERERGRGPELPPIPLPFPLAGPDSPIAYAA